MTNAAEAAREKTLDLIAQAESLLSEAAQTACPLVGWSDEWTAIGNQYDAVHTLWHRCNEAPLPTRLDTEPRQPTA